MARGTTLTELVSMVKAELFLIDTDAIAPGGDAVLFRQIAMQQNWLAQRHTWPFLTVEATVDAPSGSQYLPFPQVSGLDVFDLSQPIEAHCYYGEFYYPMGYGINPMQYNYLNPDLDQRCDPARRWQLYRTTSLQFEIWPKPATDVTIRFIGQARIPALTVGTDTAVLDDMLIAQFTAAKLAARLKQADAPALLAQAQATLQALRAGYPDEVPTFNTTMGTGCRGHGERPTVATMITDTSGLLRSDSGQVLLADSGQALVLD